MGYSIEILNNIRLNASVDYQDRIPQATRENIASIGNALQTYSLLQNEFCEALFNKIGKTIIEQKLFKNKLARFKQGTIMDQKDVEEIFIEMAKSEGTYDPKGPNPLGRRDYPDVKTIYHRMNRQDYYCVSVGDLDFRRVFQSEDQLDAFIKGFIQSIYSGAEYDEWVAMKELIATYDGYYLYQVESLGVDSGGELVGNIVAGTTEGMVYVAKQFIKTIRKAVQDLSFASTKYNKAGVKTWTNPENLVLMVHKDVLAEIDVEVLAKAFNIGRTDIQVEIIPMDDFGTLEHTYGIMVDKEWFRVYDTLSHFEPQRNAQGLFTNYFYHVHQILSASTFKNAVRFTCGSLPAE